MSTRREQRIRKAVRQAARRAAGLSRPWLSRKVSVVIDGERTSLSLEWTFAAGLKRMARETGKSIHQIVGDVHRRKPGDVPLSNAVRAEIFAHFVPPERTDG